MGAEVGSLEERLKCWMGQLQSECGIFERILYKNKNQHRRCSYFRYLLRVRRDLRLLQSTKLEQTLASCFHVIGQNKPTQKLHLLERILFVYGLKWKMSDCGTPNFMERLLGAARLLSQMVEPILKAAIEVSTLLARSFFMGFCLTVLALLARLKVLVQQILLDVVIVFNMVTTISQEKQCLKITEKGLEVYREYYPTNKDFITLECRWSTDKFILLEQTHETDGETKDDNFEGTPVRTLAPQYRSIKSILGDDLVIEKANNEDETGKRGIDFAIPSINTLPMGLSNMDQSSKFKVGVGLQVTAGISDQKLPPDQFPALGSSSSSKPWSATPTQVAFLDVKRSAPSNPAFVSVKRQATSSARPNNLELKESEKETVQNSFFTLLTGGNFRDGLF